MSSPIQVEFETLLGPILDASYGMAMSYTSNSADAEDLVQEAALKAFKGFNRFERGTNFKAWFFRILMNTAVSRYRKKKRRPAEVDLEEIPGTPLLDKAESTGLRLDGADPAQAFMERIRVDRVHEAIGELPEEFRQVSILYFLEEFTYPEIAEVLSVPVGTVRSRLHRARKALQRRLMDVAIEDGIVSGPSGQDVTSATDAPGDAGEDRE